MTDKILKLHKEMALKDLNGHEVKPRMTLKEAMAFNPHQASINCACLAMNKLNTIGIQKHENAIEEIASLKALWINAKESYEQEGMFLDWEAGLTFIYKLENIFDGVYDAMINRHNEKDND